LEHFWKRLRRHHVRQHNLDRSLHRTGNGTKSSVCVRHGDFALQSFGVSFGNCHYSRWKLDRRIYFTDECFLEFWSPSTIHCHGHWNN
jgi:hypothetical protein